MSKNDIFRAILHFPVGCIGAALTWYNTPVGILFSLGFITYEIMEDWRIADQSYKDVFGFLIGFAMVSLALLLNSLVR